MKIKNIEQLHSLEDVVSKCRMAVWIESPRGERFDLKDSIDRLRGFARLLDDDKNEMEFFANEVDDQLRIAKLLYAMNT